MSILVSDTAPEARIAQLGFRLRLVRDEGDVWIASAQRFDSGHPFGPPIAAGSPTEATAQLAAWLEWQRDHAAALQALQAAEAVYHRLAVQTFAGAGSAGREGIRLALAALDDARRTLDAIRERRR